MNISLIGPPKRLNFMLQANFKMQRPEIVWIFFLWRMSGEEGGQPNEFDGQARERRHHSCLPCQQGNPIDFPCPRYAETKERIARKIGPGIKSIEWTH
jgi:hypothetical protein